MKCPFLPSDIRVLRDAKPELMNLVVHPKLPGVYFLGFVQAHGPMIPCVESQVPYVADLIQVQPLDPPVYMFTCAADQVTYPCHQKKASCTQAMSMILSPGEAHMSLMAAPSDSAWRDGSDAASGLHRPRISQDA